MRVLQGYGVGAVQDDPAENTDAEFVDARRAGGQGEVREVRQAARAILSCTAERRAGVYEGLLKNPPGVNRRALAMMVKCCQRSMPTVMLRPITWPIFAVFASNFAQAGSFAIPSCALPCASQ